MAKTILVWRSFYPEHIERVKEIAPEYEIIKSLDEVENIEDIEIVFSWDDEAENFIRDERNQVKWIQTSSAGIDNLPLDLLEEKGIQLTNASGIHAHGISESIFAMLLNYTRGIGKALKAQQKAEWMDFKQLLELNNKTIMIVGTGKIGEQTGKLAKAFGMKTIGVNRSGRDVKHMDKQYVQEELPKVLKQADIIVNILPLTSQTEFLFDKELFDEMKDHTIFINVGRGSTVKTEDLINALDSDRLKFAGLDVVHEEPLPKDHPLWKRKDVLITPHFSGALEDYNKSLFPIFEENLQAFVNGKELPLNVVDYSKGY